MPSRQDRRKVKAPHSRIYSSEPGYHQRKFPPRNSTSLASTKLLAPRNHPKQKTLTQLDFASVPSDSQSETCDENDNFSEEEFEETRPTKRRKVLNDLEAEKQQSTLTQIGFFESDLCSDEDEDVVGDVLYGEVPVETASHVDEGIGRTVKEEVSTSLNLNTHDLQGCDPAQSASPRAVLEPTQLNKKPSPIPVLVPSPLQQTFKTPEKRIKREIPSSQSPPATPLIWVSPSPSISRRTPLQDIPANVIAMRDASPSRKPRKLPPSSDELEDDDEENMDPNPIKAESMSQNAICFPSPHTVTYVAATNAPTFYDLQSFHQATKITRTPPRSNENPAISSYSRTEPYAVHSSQATTVDATQPSPRGTTQGFCASSSPSSPTFRIPSSYSPLPEDSQLPLSEDIGHYSPLSSIQGSADIVTVSQLLPDSLLED